MPVLLSARLRELGLELPSPAPPIGSYVPVVIEGNLAWISGQIAMLEGRPLHPGLVGAAVDPATARDLARRAALQALGALAAALGNVDRIQRIVRLGVYVAVAPGFDRPHEVANGASDLLRELFGEERRPARASFGVSVLPLGAPVEVEMTAAVG